LWNKIIQEGGGLITKRTVRQWLFDAEDPLLAYAQPSSQNVALLRNDTSTNSSAALYNASSFYTGKNNLTQVQSFITYQGSKYLNGIFNFSIKVWGTNDWGQFQPFLDKNSPTDLFTFSDDDYRTLHLYDSSKINNATIIYNVTIKGIPLLRFKIDQSIYLPDPAYFQSVTGFNNLTGANGGAPIFVSNPHFAGVQQPYPSRIDGIQPNDTLDTTYVDIEPNTGLVLNTYQGSQINIYLNNSDWFQLDQQPQLDTFYPLVWISEVGTLNDYAAGRISAIFRAQKWAKYGFLVFVGFGLLFLIIGIVAIVVSRRLRQKIITTESPLFN